MRLHVYWCNKLLRKIDRLRLRAPTEAERLLISSLRRLIDGLPLPEEGTGTDPFWAKSRMKIRRDLLDKDPRRLFDFSVIRETMFVDEPPYVLHELRVLRDLSDWKHRWTPAIRESQSVPAPGYPYFRKSSGNLIHQAFHIYTLERLTGVDVTKMEHIIELGGGYGGMCRLIHRLGFRGRYFIFDLPEFSALQKFYLAANGVPIVSLRSERAGATCISEISEFEDLKRSPRLDLFLALWSLSETPHAFRRTILEDLCPVTWLIAYQHTFGKLDNAGFFSDWSAANRAWRWQTIPIDHMPDPQSYLVGTKQAID